MELFKLTNGIEVIFEKIPYVHTLSLGVYVKSGSAYENKKNNGISHLIEHMVFKGTKKRSARDIAKQTALIGDDINAYTENESTVFYGNTTTDNFEAFAEMFADMIINSSFEEKSLEKEKNIVENEIDMYNDSPDDIVQEQLELSCFPDEPVGFAVCGSKENVEAFTRDEVYERYLEYFIPENMVISIAGNLEIDRVKEVIENNFGVKGFSTRKSIRSAELTSLEIRNQLVNTLNTPYTKKYTGKKSKKVRYVPAFKAVHKDIEQLHINVAFPALALYDERRFAMAVLNSYLGESNNSLLFQKIREDLGLAYSVSSYSSNYMFTGLMLIDMAVNAANAEKACEGLFELLNDVKEKGISESELLIHKEQLVTELIMEDESMSYKMETNGSAVFFGKYKDEGGNDDPLRYIVELDEKIRRVREVSLKEVNELLKNFIDFSKMSMCIVGNGEEIEFNKIEKEYLKWRS